MLPKVKHKLQGGAAGQIQFDYSGKKYLSSSILQEGSPVGVNAAIGGPAVAAALTGASIPVFPWARAEGQHTSKPAYR